MLLKTISKIALPVVVVAILASCGGKTATGVVLTPKSTTIKGDLGTYFEVVQQDYPIATENGNNIINVEVKRTNADYSFDAQNTKPFGGGDANFHVGFGIELFDSIGPKGFKNPTDTGKMGVYNASDITGLINLKKGETGYIRWAIENVEGLKTFQLSSALEGANPQQAPAVQSNSAPAAAKDVVNWDKVLDEYEALTNQYISLSKKAKNKDIGALAELPLVLGQANTVGNKVKAAKGQLTPAQWSRYISIQTKLVQASV